MLDAFAAAGVTPAAAVAEPAAAPADCWVRDDRTGTDATSVSVDAAVSAGAAELAGGAVFGTIETVSSDGGDTRSMLVERPPCAVAPPVTADKPVPCDLPAASLG
jgi:hypothetical protein